MSNKVRTINIPIFVPHLGCPNDCVFCDQKQITTKKEAPTGEYVKKLIENALEDIAPIRSRVHIEAAFFGGSFTAIDERLRTELLSAAYEYIDELDGLRLSTRPDCIDDYILSQLKSYGVTAIELGAQSMADEVLLKSNRGHTSGDTKKASHLIKKYGFSLVLQMMTGLPGDSEDTSIFTAKEIIKLRPDAVRIYPSVVLPNTKLWDMAKSGEYMPHGVDEAVKVCSKIIPMFRRENISILRVGLMDNEILSHGSVMGAYHPSLGELCYSEVFYNAACDILRGSTNYRRIEIHVPYGAVSKMTGHRGKNIERLKEKFSLKSVKVRECERLKDFDVEIINV